MGHVRLPHRLLRARHKRVMSKLSEAVRRVGGEANATSASSLTVGAASASWPCSLTFTDRWTNMTMEVYTSTIRALRCRRPNQSICGFAFVQISQAPSGGYEFDSMSYRVSLRDALKAG